VIVNVDAFDERNLEKAGYAANPLDDGTPRRLPRLRGPDDRASPRRRSPRSASSPATPSGRRTSSRSGSCRGCTPARSSRPSSGSPRSSAERTGRSRRTRRRSRPATTSARPPSSSATATRSSRPCRPGVHQHHRQHRARLGPRRRRPARRSCPVPRLVPDHAGVRHPPRAVEAQELRCPHRAGRRRDRRIGGARRRVRRPLGVTTTSGPGVALKSETISLAVSIELPL
jgi:2-oxoglutarate/2-oxoacid ferredoxin oxidoreductase subunit alpha